MDQLDPFRDDNWDLIDINSFLDEPPFDFYWNDHTLNQRNVTELDVSLPGSIFQEKEYVETECRRKRARNNSCSKRRVKLADRD